MYVALDTCVWIQLIRIDLSKEFSVFDKLCYWIENKHLKHIVAENIIREWDRNKAGTAKNSKDSYKKYQNNILRSFEGNHMKDMTLSYDDIDSLIDERIDRVDKLLKHYSEKALENQNIYNEAVQRSLNCIAPNHEKNSFLDTVNILTIINHLKEQGYVNCIFSTENFKDFSDEKDRRNLHEQLKSDFEEVKLQYVFCDKKPFGGRLFGVFLEPKLPSYEDYLKKKRYEEDEKKLTIKKSTATIIENPDIDYLENIKHLDMTIFKKNPTVWEQDMVRELIRRHDSYKQYFLNNIEETVWFDFLKSEGFFSPEENPEPVKNEDGDFQIPYWGVLGYLERLSVQIKDGKAFQYIEELLSIIKSVSEHPKDNYRTWYCFIKILSNIPNEKVPIEILRFIPVWFSGQFDTMLQTSALCDKLLLKFLSGSPTSSDVKKAELILSRLFQVEKSEVDNIALSENNNIYYSRLYLQTLANRFERGELTSNIVKHCSSDFILELGRTIKFLLLGYFKEITSSLNSENGEYKVRIVVDKENLLVSLHLQGDEETKHDCVLSDWEEKDRAELEKELLSIIKSQNIEGVSVEELDSVFQSLNFALNTHGYSIFGLFNNTIRELGGNYSSSQDVLSIFSLIFRDLLNEKAKHNSNETLVLLSCICFDYKYNLSFFRRIALYVICENWNNTKSLFWDLIKDNDKMHLFSNYVYRKEMFELLMLHQNSFENKNIRLIEQIIEKGEQGNANEPNEDSEKYWRLRWFSALKDIKPFKNKYIALSDELCITSEHYQNVGKIQYSTGFVSPFTKDDLLKKSNQEIVELIKNFKSKRICDEPTVNGLAMTLEAAIETNPKKFITDIELYQDIPYIYFFYVFKAFKKVLEEQKELDFEKILHYILSVIKSPRFYSNELQLEGDYWHTKLNSVLSSIADLLSEGLKNDKYLCDLELLPLIKEALQVIIPNLDCVDDIERSNMDYPTYFLNSTAGKVLKVLLDYSLCRARNLTNIKNEMKWEEDVKSLLEKTLTKGIVDGYILEGMFFRQFCFLDYLWIKGQVKQHCDKEDKEWLAFMSGFIFGKPPQNEELYELFYFHYERLIDSDLELKSHVDDGLVYHLTSFYFWGNETSNDKNLLLKFINKASVDKIYKLISFISNQEGFLRTLSNFEKQDFQQRIEKLWRFLTEKYKYPKVEEEQKNLASLANWIVFVPELNEVYTELILGSCEYIYKAYSMHNLLKSLVLLKQQGNPRIVAKYIGVILLSLKFSDYQSENFKEPIIDLVVFLYSYGQDECAKKFCNTMASVHQQFFLRDIYEANL